MTLGQLNILFQACIDKTKDSSELLNKLKDYAELRNRLAHKMLTNKKLTYEQCVNAIDLGDDIIEMLLKFAGVLSS